MEKCINCDGVLEEMSTEHMENLKFICQDCGPDEQSFGYYGFLSHLKTCHDSKKVECLFGCEAFLDYRSFVSHLSIGEDQNIL